MEYITLTMSENAEKFVIRWRGITSEKAESQTFINEFFEIFGLNRKDLAQFEKPIRKKNEHGVGFADLFWSGKLLIEAKSAEKDSDKHWEQTLKQAEEYIENLLPYQRPQYILLMNFRRFQKYKVMQFTGSKPISIKFEKEILLENLAHELDYFTFFPEFANQLEDAEEKINQEAARLIANVYDAIDRKGYEHSDLAILFARLMFCMFAEDTGIFKLKQFENFLRHNTTYETLGEKLQELFRDLSGFQNLTGLKDFPYVNGGLFEKEIPKIPSSSPALRETLIKCCEYDWSFISPVIFGSLFQSVMHQEDRRTLGAHYTSERNIMRVIRPLFLDELRGEFEKVKDDRKQLEKFRKKISQLTFLDPACGCGNFLVVIYRELRLLDIEIIRILNKGQFVTDVNLLNNVLLTNFYGYEIDSTSAMIAEVAMWLTEHQCNMRLENEFGKTVPTIPLKQAAQIINCNSLTIEWTTGTEGKYFDYILGNPPFVGKQYQTKEQKEDIVKIFEKVNGNGILDYVTGWYLKAAKYTKLNNSVRIAFVSTNSISQGEQTGVLWGELFNNYDIKINFAHQTFKWSNEAKGLAAVHCIIVGFGRENIKEKYLFEYSDIKAEPEKKLVRNINGYLVEGENIIIQNRTTSICNVQQIIKGSETTDDGHLMLNEEEVNILKTKFPETKEYIRPFIGGGDFINGKIRYCLWLKNANPEIVRRVPLIAEKVNNVKKFREKSPKERTRKWANFPTLFSEDRQPNSKYLFIPKVSSERRNYIPFAFVEPEFIINNTASYIENASNYLFGILTSKMHMTWISAICGRMKSDFIYSNKIVYNNYPFPENPSEKQIKAIEEKAQKVLDVRLEYPNSSLADLYDPLSMPVNLLKAHHELDKAVDLAYRPQPFTSEAKRLEYLFELYEKYIRNFDKV